MNENSQADEPLERLLSQALRAGRPPDVCPDAEELAAFVEHALDVDAANEIELHVADCARCAAVVSTLLDTEPTLTTRAAPWWSSWPARWAVPMATAAVVAGVWFSTHPRNEQAGGEKPLVVATRDVVGGPGATPQGPIPVAPQQQAQPQERQVQEQPARERAEARKSPSVDTAPTSQPAKDAQPETRRDVNGLTALVPGISGQSARGAGQGFGLGDGQGAPQPQFNAHSSTSALESGPKQEAASPPSTPSAPAAAEVAKAAESSAANRSDTVNDAAAQRLADAKRDENRPAAAAASPEPVPAVPAVQARAEAPAGAPAPPVARGGGAGGGRAGGGRGGGGRGGAGGRVAGAAGGAAAGAAPPGAAADGLNQGRIQVDGLTVRPFAPIVLSNASGSIEWRVQGLTVERSADGGAAWTPVYTAPRPIVAGAVASDDTVWLVGQQGLVVRGTTGSGWAAVTAPAAVDLSNVSQVTARGATVRTTDGRDFRSDDGGVTWTQR